MRSSSILLALAMHVGVFGGALAQQPVEVAPPPVQAPAPEDVSATCLERFSAIPGYKNSAFVKSLCSEKTVPRGSYMAVQPPPVFNNDFLNFEFKDQVAG